MSMGTSKGAGTLRKIAKAFWKSEKGNEVVTWVVIAALIVVIAVFIFGPNPNSLQTALRNVVDYIISLLASVIG